jgi:hypothetical protein
VTSFKSHLKANTMSTVDRLEAAPMTAISADAFSSMFQAVSGLRNIRAAMAMLSCFALSVFASGLLSMMLGKGASAIFFSGLLAVFLVFSGVHAGGLMLMDQAKRAPMRSVTEAIVAGMWCVPKTILLIIGLVVAFIAVYLLIALLFFICKMPGLGPLLYVVVFPVSVAIAGLTFAGLFLGATIALAALWEGATVTGALVKAFSVLSTRLVETALLAFVVMVLAGLVFSFVGVVLTVGFMPAVGLSVKMLGASPELLGSLGSMLMGSSGSNGPGSYALAGSFGSALLFALTMTLVFQVWLLGINLLYLKVTEGLDSSATEGALQQRLAEARRKAAEMGSKAKQAAEQAQDHTSQAVEKFRTPRTEPAPNLQTAAATAVTAVAAPSVAADVAESGGGPAADTPADDTKPIAIAHTHCPACATAISPDDLFCGSCGHRLKT